MRRIPRALTIAGSDSGGCAGIQADLKTFAALRVHGMSVITSVTAQDTRRVYQSTDLPAEMIRAQIQAVVEDIGTDAVKTGMLASSEIIRTVARSVKSYSLHPLVVDPVMVTTGGDRLIDPEAVATLKAELIPLAQVVTPNLPEAEALTGRKLHTPGQIQEAAAEILSWGASAVLVKGGHGKADTSTDYFVDGAQILELVQKRVATHHTHGSGCTLASAIAAYLALGHELVEAVKEAKKYVTAAIEASFPLGQGHGPLGHFFAFWKEVG